MESTGIVPTMPITGGDSFGFGNGGLWLFAILALMWGGNGFFGNNGSLGFRQATIKYYRLVETNEAELRGSMQKQAPAPEYATKAELDALARKIEELSKPKAAPEV